MKSGVQYKLFGIFFCALMLSGAAMAQDKQNTASPTASPQPSPQQTASKPETASVAADPADVASADAIVAALYNVISGDAGVKRDWNRFRSLFYPGARMIPTAANREGKIVGRIITPEDYVERSGALLEKDGFHERELARRVEMFGNITHVFSTYEAKRKLSDPKPLVRGVNSIQLFNDGTRWYILTVAWSPETPENQLPEKYLKN